MTRLLHTADWQIGRQYGSFDPDDAVPLAEARFAAVERIAALATAEQVDAVLVAGDVFDAQTVSARSIRRLFNALEAYAGPWVLLPGNHDAALAESVWTHAQRLAAVPENVHLALVPGVVELPQARLACLCAPLTQRHTHGDPTAWFDGAATPAGWHRVGLAHGAVQGLLAEGIDAANPIAPDRAERARLAYLALGDWHGTRRIDARTWYSGTPEPDRFRNNEAGQVLLVELPEPAAAAAEPPAPAVRALPTAQYTWRQHAAVLQVPSDVDALLAWLAEAGAGDVIELTLQGALDVAAHTRLLRALDETEARVRCLRRELAALQLAPTEADLAALQADGYVGEVMAALRQAGGEAGHPQAACAQDALALLTGLLAARRPATP